MIANPRTFPASDRDGVIRAADQFRSPPYNVEAEAGVLGSMLLDNSVIPDVAIVLKPADFFRDAHRLVAEAIFALADGAAPVDAILLVEELRRRGHLEAVGGEDAVVALVLGVNHALNAAYYARVVRDKSVVRALIAAGDSLCSDSYSDRFTAGELLARAESAVFAISRSEVRTRHAHASEAAVESMDRLSRRDGGEVVGLPTGFLGLDSVIDGLAPGQVVIVGARPAIGKTSLALDICRHVSVTLKAPSLFVSLEMGRSELADRMLAAISGVHGHKFRDTGKLTPGDRAAIDAAYGQVRDSRLYIDDTPGLDLAQVASLARRQKGREGLDLLVIDYLQRIRYELRRGESHQYAVAGMSNRIKDLARELQVPVLLLSQLNRGPEDRPDLRPRMSDLRDTGALEQDADVVLLLHRPDAHEKHADPLVSQAELIVAKQRNGATRTVPLVFEKALSRFVDPQQLAAEADECATPY